MNNRLSKLILISIIFFLISCNSKKLYVLQKEGVNLSIPLIIEETICSLTNLPSYSSEMKIGDEFLLVVSPGFSFPELNELSFANSSGDELIGSLVIVDEAYRFAKLVNKLVSPSHSYHDTGMLLGEYYAEVIHSHTTNGVNIHDMNRFNLTSSTYDDSFYFTTINPFSTHLNDSWVQLDNFVSKLDTLDVNGIKVGIISPTYEVSGSFVRLNIERPWFKWTALEVLDRSVTSNLAMITGLILSKELSVSKYSDNSNVVVSRNRKKVDNKITPNSVMQTKSNLIIGFVCKLI
jgi:hypothetical protein